MRRLPCYESFCCLAFGSAAEHQSPLVGGGKNLSPSLLCPPSPKTHSSPPFGWLVQGMVQANVGQKLVKSNILQVFLMSNDKFLTLHLENPMQYRNHPSICYSANLNHPTNYIVTLVKPFSFVCYVLPLLKTGALALTRDLFLQVDDEKTWKKQAYAWPIATIGRNTCPMVASSGFYQSPAPPSLGDACGIVPAHLRGSQNGQQSWPIITLFFVCCCPGGRWGNMERVVVRRQHPVASGIALDMLHWEMRFILHRRTAMAIKTAGRQRTFDRHQRFHHCHKLSYLT